MKLLPILTAVLFAVPANAFDKQSYLKGLVDGGTISSCRLYNNGDITIGELTDEFKHILFFAEKYGLGESMEQTMVEYC